MPILDATICDRLLRSEGERLVAAVSRLADPESPLPSDVQRLRAIGPTELVPAALELVAARRRAARKIERAERLLCDPEGVEQASGTAVARHKAARFAAAGVGTVVDVCCGIGGDAIELVRAGVEVVGIDRNPARARMTAHNARCAARVGDATEQKLADAGVAVHVDPARRVERARGRGGRRLWRLEDLEPPVDVVERLLVDRPTAWKLGPGAPLTEIPGVSEREIEIVGDRQGLLQCVVWSGPLARAPGQRTATRLRNGEPLTFTAAPGAESPDPANGVGEYLLVPDAALERAGLVAARVGARGFAELAPGLGLLTGDRAIDDPWFESHHVLATMSWRERRIGAWLDQHGGGEVVVRTRGRAVDVDRAGRALRRGGDRRFVVFGLRLGKRVIAVITG